MSGYLRIALCVMICGGCFLSPDADLILGGGWEFPQTVNAMTPLSAISFRNRVRVSGERVTLLDLCHAESLPEDWKTYMAGIDIGAAPEANAIKVINLKNLRSYFSQLETSQGLQAGSVTLQIPERIVVERRKQVIARARIEEIVREHILSSFPGKPDDVAIQLTGLEQLPSLPEGALTWEILTPFHDPAAGTTVLTVQFYVDGIKSQSVRVACNVQVFQKVVCASRPLKRNDIINAEDVQEIRTDVAQHPEKFLTDIDQAVGKRLLMDVAKSQPVSAQILDKAVTVKRGTAVVVVYQQEGLKLTARGRAKEDGSLGDRIRIANTDSKRTLTCRVLDPQTVELLP